MQESTKSSVLVVICPECKTNQAGNLNVVNTCINSKCNKEFTPTEEIPVIVWSEVETNKY
ncbi:MAG: hypothetical protein ACN4E2_01120 [Nitrospinota bacterium]